MTLGLAAALHLGAMPGSTVAQETDAARRRVEVRAGLAGHGAGLCSRRAVTGTAVGLALRTSGRLIGAVGGDYFFGGQPQGCLGVEIRTRYDGQDVRLRAGSDIGLRLSLATGYRLFRDRLEITGAAGALPTKTDNGPGADDVDWRLWFGTALTFRLGSGVGLQSEIGLHQVAERYLALSEEIVIADELYWEPMWRVAFSIPII